MLTGNQIRFACCDRFLKISRFFFNPYRATRKFQQKEKKANLYVYGETPLYFFKELFEKYPLTKKDIFVDIGSGRGKVCFWVSCFQPCLVRGYERVFSLFRFSHWIKKILRLKNLDFFHQDFTQVKEIPSTWIYLCGTCFEDEEIEQLIDLIPKNTHVISISFPLSFYRKEVFQPLEILPIVFPWGKTKAYLEKKL